MKAVLVIDDEFGIADAVNDILSDEGYSVYVARNGAEGLKRLRENKPQLILLDLMMPIMSGPEMLAILRADAELSSTPVVMMSAVSEQKMAVGSTYQAFLRKPFDLVQLLEVVEKLIGKGERQT